MSEPLRVLILEDREEDAHLMLRELRSSGFDPAWKRVDNPRELEEALDHRWDVILADYVMPEFDAAQALRIVQARKVTTPFIVVSGNIGEEVAVATMKMGAADYLLKDRLGRLGPAVKNAIEQQRLRIDAENTRDSLDTSLANQRILEQQQADILDALPAHVAVLDREGRVIRVNRGWEKFGSCQCLHGVGGSVGQNLLDLCSSAAVRGNDFAEQTVNGIRQVLDGAVSSFELEYPCCPLEGRQHWFRLMATPLDGLGPERAVVMKVDTTDLVYAKEANRRLAAILEATPDLVGLAELDGTVLYLNRSGRELVGLPCDERVPVEGNIRQIHPEWASDLVFNVGFPHAIEHGMWSGETAILHREDGREIPVSQVILAHRSSSGQVAYVSTVARDITQLRQLEETIRQSQKLEAVGRLAGGIAHDFNNILTIILGYSDLIEESLGEHDRNREWIGGVSEAARRAAVLTRQLLAFSRKQILQPRVMNLNSSVAEIEKILKRLIGEDIELLIELPEGLPDIKADPGQIEQVILTLAVNARDAMPEGGQLRIATRAWLQADAGTSRPKDLPAGDFVELRVVDTGCGMKPEVVQHIFEPFFTTKGSGNGTGLGLAMVYGIVKQSEGHILVESRQGVGTTFRIFLPTFQEPAQQAADPLTTDGQHGEATLLLVEDDESVRRLARYSLQLQGYHVLDASSGPEALTVSRAFGEPIDLLLTDIVMPRMSGRELANELRVERPELKVIYVSGYSDDARVQEQMSVSEGNFLQKPFTNTALLTKVREVLQKK